MGLADLVCVADRPRSHVRKGPTLRRLKGRKDRAEAAVKKAVRALCVERDGACRIGEWELNPDDWHADALESCEGRSEWAHLVKRSQTRKMAPEARHNTQITVMLCQHHHAEQESGQLIITAATDLGADGLLEFKL